MSSGIFVGRTYYGYLITDSVHVKSVRYNLNIGSRDSDYATGWTSEGSGLYSLRGQEISLHHNVQTGSGSYPASYT
jgi:hypothetical protein